MLISNDQHLDMNNMETVKRLLIDQMNKAIELGLHEVTWLGDMFDVRSNQKLDVAITFLEILDEYGRNGIKAVCVSGNHDRADYSSHNSWITLFRSHPALDLINDIEVRQYGEVSATFMPFFIEEMMVERLEAAEPTDLFLGHLEMNGSANNGVVAKDRVLSPSMFKKFKQTYLGHYHNYGDINDRIHHLPSLYQRNYGEDDIKGYTIVYDDLSSKHVQSDFKRFKTVKVDIDTLTPEEQRKLLKSKENDVNLRIEVTGSSEKMKAFKKDSFTQAGIDVKIKHDKVFEIDKVELHEVKGKDIRLTVGAIREKFSSFCKRDELNMEEGKQILEKVLGD